MTEPLIDPQRVTDILRDCLYLPDELTEAEDGTPIPPADCIIVEGIMRKFGLHPQRLESHRDEVRRMLLDLPMAFRADTAEGGGGGWSFLNACQDINDTQWTGMHQVMDELFVLGIGLDLAAWALPREMWPVLPGGMPYVVVKVP